MTLWNIIRDWFVINVFGGVASSGQTYDVGTIGFLYNSDGSTFGSGTSSTTYIPINLFNANGRFEVSYIRLADWLSTTLTIIVLCAMCFFLFLVVRWLFRLTSGLLSGRG